VLVVLAGGLVFREEGSGRFWGEVGAAADGGLARVAAPVDADGGCDADVEGLREARHGDGEVTVAQLAHGDADAGGFVAEDKLRRTGYLDFGRTGLGCAAGRAGFGGVEYRCVFSEVDVFEGNRRSRMILTWIGWLGAQDFEVTCLECRNAVRCSIAHQILKHNPLNIEG
jgi:hypothetical protein